MGMIQTLSLIQLRVINKNRNDPDSVTDTVRVINKNRNDPDSVIDTVRVINKHRNDPDSVTDTVRVIKGMIQTLSLIQLE
jgi:hypothetical protein